MRVTRRAALLEPREMEERRGKVVSLRQLATVDLIPGIRPKRKVLGQPEVTCAERLENPARPPLDALGDPDGGRHRRESTYP